MELIGEERTKMKTSVDKARVKTMTCMNQDRWTNWISGSLTLFGQIASLFSTSGLKLRNIRIIWKGK